MSNNNSNALTAREEILDTIKVCEEYLEDAAKFEGCNVGAVFAADAVAFAKAQITFEKGRLAAL